jgi:hypothetical protein
VIGQSVEAVGNGLELYLCVMEPSAVRYHPNALSQAPILVCSVQII